MRQRIEQIGSVFRDGYHFGLTCSVSELPARLAEIDLEDRGFGYEAAATGLTLLDALFPRRPTRLQAFLTGPAAAHVYMVHVGAGWVSARVPWLRRRVAPLLGSLNPLLRWLALDGYAFGRAYFEGPVRGAPDREAPGHLRGYARRAYDQGYGRVHWFLFGGDPGAIRDSLAACSPHRRADLWSGVGLACAYAGGVGRSTVEELLDAAGAYRAHLAQGAAFAAKARERAGNPAPHTELACRVLCDTSAVRAAAVTDAALAGLPMDETGYAAWRARIVRAFAERGPGQ